MKIAREELLEMVATRLTEVQSQQDLEVFYYRSVMDYYRDRDDEILMDDAVNMNLIEKGTEIE